jgi:hypothetical protein
MVKNERFDPDLPLKNSFGCRVSLSIETSLSILVGTSRLKASGRWPDAMMPAAHCLFRG